MEVEIISREAIKPSKPTPPHCKTYNISILDQWLPGYYIPIMLFYQSPATLTQDMNNNENLRNRIKSSLSDVLAHYYPFAGKFKDIVSIDCNDDGVLFVEARVKNKLMLADVLAHPPEPSSLNVLLPDDLQWKTPEKDEILLAVQLSRFDCGGFSIGICWSHKIADACTISNFLADWATLARQPTDDTMVVGPLLNGSSLFPPDDQFPYFFPPEMPNPDEHNFVTRRFLFPSTNVLELKAAVISTDNSLKPSRVEVVNSVLYKSIVKAWKNKSPCMFVQAMDVRSRMATTVPANSMGNFIWNFTVTVNKDDNDSNNDGNLGSYVAKLKDELKKSCDFARSSEAKDWIAKSMQLFYQALIHDPTSYISGVSSWCRYPLYQMDFGFGKPIWVSTITHPKQNSIILIDTVDGQGVEAWVTLNAEHMATLQGDDEELLKFAMLNPSVVVHDSDAI